MVWMQTGEAWEQGCQISHSTEYDGTQHAPRPLVAKKPADTFFPHFFPASNLFPKQRNLVLLWTFLGCSLLCRWQQCHQWVLSASSREYWYSWQRPLPWRAPTSSQRGELSVWVGKMPVTSIHRLLTTYGYSLSTVLQEYCPEYIITRIVLGSQLSRLAILWLQAIPILWLQAILILWLQAF